MLRKVIVPTELADITLKDYQRFMGANPTDETFNQLALSIFCGIDQEEYPLFPKAQLEEIETLVQFTLNEKLTWAFAETYFQYEVLVCHSAWLMRA